MHVTMNDDGTLTIEWDETDPKEMHLNDWTEDDFIAALKNMFQEWDEFDDGVDPDE